MQRSEAGAEFDAGIGWPALVTAAEHIALALTNLTLRDSLREDIYEVKVAPEISERARVPIERMVAL